LGNFCSLHPLFARTDRPGCRRIKPLMIANIMQSITLIADSCTNFRKASAPPCGRSRSDPRFASSARCSHSRSSSTEATAILALAVRRSVVFSDRQASVRPTRARYRAGTFFRIQ
jgi:hypothetical protein